LAPLFSIWVGTGAQSKMAVSSSIALFAIVVDSVPGLRSADHTMRAAVVLMARKLKASYRLC
jgi:NitT/TauT family transport system permease protein